MKLEEVLPSLKQGKAIQRESGKPWIFLKRGLDGSPQWFGSEEDPAQGVPMFLVGDHLLAEDWRVIEEATALAAKPSGTFNCPRRKDDEQVPKDGKLHDFWRVYATGAPATCCYCGSINADVFMSMVEDQRVTLTPTDDSQKVYVDGEGLQSAKFYFEHMSDAQRRRFIELYNERKLRFYQAQPFYVLPYFMQQVEPEPTYG